MRVLVKIYSEYWCKCKSFGLKGKHWDWEHYYLQEVFSFPVLESHGHEQVFQLTLIDSNKYFRFEWIIAWGQMGPMSHINWECHLQSKKDLSVCSLSQQRTNSHLSNHRCFATKWSLFRREFPCMSSKPSHLVKTFWRAHPSFRGAHAIGDTVMQMFTRAEPTWLPATRTDRHFGCARCKSCWCENIHPFPDWMHTVTSATMKLPVNVPGFRSVTYRP